MPSSSLSLGSLSSPSPSPSPRPGPSKAKEASNAAPDSDSELSELTEEEQETEDRSQGKKKGRNSSESHSNSHKNKPSRRGRRKRSSLVPAPMWGWAGTKTNPEEEEEEEDLRENRIMEEEEEEGEDEGEESVPSKEEIENVHEPNHNASSKVDAVYAAAPADEDVSDFEDDAGDAAEGPKQPISRIVDVSVLDVTVPPISTLLPTMHADDEEEEEEDEEDEGEDENGEDEDTKSDHDADQNALADEDVEPDSDSEAEDGDDVSTVNVYPSQSRLASAATVQPLKPMASAGASIMAGAEILRPVSPVASESQASESAASSRAPSPVPEEKKQAVNGDAPKARRIDRRKSKAGRNIDEPGSAETKGKDVDVDMDIVGDGVDADDPTPENELEMELEADLQPAHRAEALDVLAIIELKFALLRERVYVEKIEGLAWEEELISEGTHPELIHLQTEMLKRKDKCIELATRKRDLERASIARKRRLDAEATWSTWLVNKDELQTAMIAETGRKRRKLEKERRAIDRPPPVRTLPQELSEVPIPPSLRKVVQTYPFSSQSYDDSSSLVYPELTPLSTTEIWRDLEYLMGPRHNAQGPHWTPGNMHDAFPDYMPPSQTSRPPPASHMPPYQIHGGPPLPMPQGIVGPGQPMSVFPNFPSNGGGRVSQQPPSHPPMHQSHTPLPINGPSLFASVDQDMLQGPGSMAGPIPTPAFIGPGQGPNVAYTTIPGRRSNSPGSLIPNSLKGNGQWMGPGMGMGGLQMGSSKPGNEWTGDGRREMTFADEEKERSVNRDREKRDHIQNLQHHHAGPPHPNHAHNIPAPHVPPGHPHHHHRTHHHHIVHHHPTGPAPSLSPRTAREYDRMFPGTSVQQSTEVINLTSKTAPRKGDEALDYRDGRGKPVPRAPGSVPPQSQEERERPLPIPFSMGSTRGNMRTPPATMLHTASGGASPHWNGGDDYNRVTQPSSTSAHVRSPTNRYATAPHLSRPPVRPTSRQNSISHPSPHIRSQLPLSPTASVTTYNDSAPMAPSRSPTRFRENREHLNTLPPIPSRDRSPPILNLNSIKLHRPPSPSLPNKIGSLPPLPNPPVLAGPGHSGGPNNVMTTLAESVPPSNGGLIGPGGRSDSSRPFISPPLAHDLPSIVPTSILTLDSLRERGEVQQPSPSQFSQPSNSSVPSVTKLNTPQMVDGR